MKVVASPQVYMGAMPEGQGEQVSHWWFSGIGLLTANDKDFSLSLEMTIRESLMSLSLRIAGHQSLVPSHKSFELGLPL